MIEVATDQGPARVHVHEAKGEPAGCLLLTHGAGGGLDGQDLTAIAEVLPRSGWTVALVEMPWRVAGKKVAPMPPKLDAAWRQIVPAVRADLPGRLVMGGRSAGARVACRLGAGLGAERVLCLSFPLLPAGKSPEASRSGELLTPIEAGLPVHVVQGTRDPFGGPEQVRAALAAAGVEVDGERVRVDVAPGTHSFSDGSTVAELVQQHLQQV